MTESRSLTVPPGVTHGCHGDEKQSHNHVTLTMPRCLCPSASLSLSDIMLRSDTRLPGAGGRGAARAGPQKKKKKKSRRAAGRLSAAAELEPSEVLEAEPELSLWFWAFLHTEVPANWTIIVTSS